MTGPNPTRFSGRPLPSDLLAALGTRRGGPWLIGLASATLTTVLAYWVMGQLNWAVQQPLSVIAGIVAGWLLGWAFAALAGGIDEAKRAYPDQEQELRDRCGYGLARLATITTTSTSPLKTEVERKLASIGTDLDLNGPRWLDAAGYLNAWTRLHEAEEDMLLIDSADDVVAAGHEDLLRLNGSEIPAKDKLAQEITESLLLIPVAPAVASPAVASPAGVAARRIRSVRMAINRERESSWDQVVRSRNGLITAAVVGLLISYLLVILAIGFRPQANSLVSALVFALVGASVSAAHQLFVRSQAHNDVEDFGYSNVQLLVAPIISGLVAVLAIVVLTQIQLTINGQTFGGSFTSWQTTFDWRKNSSGIGLAIVFGFAPSLLFSFLQRRVDGALSSINSSNSGGATAK